MRYGFTTGSCAAAAAKAAAYMLITGKIKNEIEIETPKGIRYHAEITDIRRSETAVSCAVIKDGGDDPDITTGAHIVAAVSRIDGGIQQKEPSVHRQKSTMDGSMQQKGQSAHLQRIVIDGGYGVGRVTKPGLDQPVGNAAINHVPRSKKRGGKSVRSRMKRQIFWWKFPCRRGRRLRHRRLIRDLASQAESPSLGRAVLWSR